MIRDTFFSLPRFVNLCRKEMIEGWKANALRVVLMYGAMAIAFVWNGYLSYSSLGQRGVEVDPTWNFVSLFFVWGFFVFGALSASFTMERMKTKTSRTAVLMTPATMFEKFFSRWLIFTIGFLVIYFFAFRLADYTRVLIYSVKYPDMEAIAPLSLSHLIGKGGTLTSLCSGFKELMLWVSLFFFVQSCFILGSSIWPKNAFLKTFVAGILIILVYGLVAGGLIKLLFLDNYYYSNNMDVSRNEGLCLGILVPALFALLNWTLAYYRFKESEIIHRM